MTTAAQFIAELSTERRNGNVSSETEQHLKHEFRSLGPNAMDAAFAAAIGLEVDRLEREAATLRRLQTELFRTGVDHGRHLSESIWREHVARLNLSEGDRHAASEESLPCHRQEGCRSGG
jgi:hypothetical protein